MSTNMTKTIMMVFVILIFLIYNYTVFKFSDMIFEKERSACKRITLSICNLLFIMVVFSLKNVTLLGIYVFIYLVLFIELVLSYKQKKTRIFLISAVYVTHIIAIGTISFSGIMWINYVFISNLMPNEYLVLLIIFFTLLVLFIATRFVMHFMPIEKIRMVLNRDEQTFFLIVWLAVCTGYMLINTTIYQHNAYLQIAYQSQILSCIIVLVGIYIMIFYGFTNCVLLNVKTENQKLKAEIENQENYREAIINHAKYHYEANLSQRKITKGFTGYEAILESVDWDYDKAISELCKILVYQDDIEKVHDIAYSKNLIERFNRGDLRQAFECRLLDMTGEFYWTEFIINLVKDSENDDIMVFSYFVDIDKDKKAVMSLKDRAERDSLTQLYNKMTTELMISEYLSDGRGVLFIVDVDNFKSVNDFMGHAKGDEVLKLLAIELKTTFRPSDIIGRIGGDEFMAFLPVTYNKDLIIRKSQDIINRFLKTFDDSYGGKHIISASVGVAVVSSDAMKFVELYKQADSALYHAKNSGKNTFHIYNEIEEQNFVSCVSLSKSE